MKVISTFLFMMSMVLFYNIPDSVSTHQSHSDNVLVCHDLFASDSLIVRDSISSLLLSSEIDSLTITADTLSNDDEGALICEQLESMQVPIARDSVFVSDTLIKKLLNARKIECELLSLNPYDTTRKVSQKVIPRNHMNVIKFLLRDESNYQTNDILYGIFKPDVVYKFQVPNKDCYYLQIDFGLKKWMLLDSDLQKVAIADMKNSAYYFLLFTKHMFPNDTTLELLYDTLKPF